MNNKPTKADAIRLVAKENLGLSDKQIQELVRERYGLEVGQNLIINTLGSQKSRGYVACYSRELIGKAARYLNAAGDLGQAKKLLDIADCEARL